MGARKLADGSAFPQRPVGSPEWLVGEILSYRGEAVVLEPQELRREIASRAQAVQRELGLSRVRVG
jgi:predicted DNA-binding transcriptional regulator YafY